jgi:DsbC/DsbD-like thiol-disulfide interchange protein
MKNMKPKLSLFFLLAMAPLALGSRPTAASAASSGWEDLGGGKARLVAVVHPDEGRIEGFVEFALEEGWKTYWKYPGDSGIAPEFDFSQSSGVAIEDMAYPVPKFIRIPGSSFAGYKGDTRFVFEGSIAGPKPSLSLNLMAGVCKDICIPAMATFAIGAAELEAGDVRSLLDIDEARKHLPVAATEGFGLSQGTLADDGKLTFEAHVPEDADDVQLFIMPPEGLFPTEPLAEDGQSGNTKIFTSSLGSDFIRDEAAGQSWEYVLTTGSEAVTGKIELRP